MLRAPVAGRARFARAERSFFLHAIDNAHYAVMPEEETIRKTPNRRLTFMGQATNSQKNLILLRFQPRIGSRVVAGAQKLSDAVAQFGQRAVIGIPDSLHSKYDYIVLRYTCNCHAGLLAIFRLLPALRARRVADPLRPVSPPQRVR
jgi:hypothetical protein